MQRVDTDMLDVIPSDLQLNGTNYIVYNEDASLPEAYDVDSLDNYLDDFYLKPLSKEKLLDDADYTITVDANGQFRQWCQLCLLQQHYLHNTLKFLLC